MADKPADKPDGRASTEKSVEVQPIDSVSKTEVDAVDVSVPLDNYGDPYDSSTPPFSVYGDPTSGATERARREREIFEQQQSKLSKADTFRFVGPSHPNDGTAQVITTYGHVSKGDTLKLPQDEVDRLAALGMNFEKV